MKLITRVKRYTRTFYSLFYKTQFFTLQQWPSHVYSDLYSTLIILLTFVLPLVTINLIDIGILPP